MVTVTRLDDRNGRTNRQLIADGWVKECGVNGCQEHLVPPPSFEPPLSDSWDVEPF